MEINGPELWRHLIPTPRADAHKYERGGVVVAGGPIASTGAARLSARAALRIGAGAVTIACDAESLPVYAAQSTAVMTRPVKTVDEYTALVRDAKTKASVLGPGFGHGARQTEMILAALAMAKPTVLDAEALTAFTDDRPLLIEAVSGPVVLTPHEGEFAKLFGDLSTESREVRVARAADIVGGIVLLKGEATLIAEPGGRLVRNEHATPYLATAGSGDVLTGMIAGLLAQRMDAFYATCAAVWMHGEAGRRFGLGLIAEDLPELLPKVLRLLHYESLGDPAEN